MFNITINRMVSLLRLPHMKQICPRSSSVCAFGIKKQYASWLQKSLRTDHQRALHSNASLQSYNNLHQNDLLKIMMPTAPSLLMCSNKHVKNDVSFFTRCAFTRTYSRLYGSAAAIVHHNLLQTRCNLADLIPPHGRFYSSESPGGEGSRQGFTIGQKNKSVMMYVVAIFVMAIGVTYAAVPLYSIFCQATGYGGSVKQGHDTSQVETMQPVRKRPILITFNADTAASMRWSFRPQQREIMVYPGETALAFYSAVNPTDKAIVGISTYNVVPFEAGKYFNKIQCFCFEEQRLNPYEQVDMPVFFFIDPEFADDPKMDQFDNIILSYTFFEAKEGLQLPDPMERR